MVKKTFEELLLEAIDDALASLGSSVRQSVYFHLGTKFGVSRSTIPDQLDDFERSLERIFGLGSRFLEILILKKLYERIRQPLEWDERKELAFVGYVAAARQSYVRKRK